jgi:hypothetical protein
MALRKIASGSVLGGDELATLEGYTIPTTFSDSLYGTLSDKYQTLQKLARMEKEIISLGSSNKLPTAAFGKSSGFHCLPKELESIIGNKFERTLNTMRDCKIVIPFELFVKLLAKAGSVPDSVVENVLPEATKRLPTLFSDMLGKPNLKNILNDGGYDGMPFAPFNIRCYIKKMIGSHGLEFGPVRQRMTTVVLTKLPAGELTDTGLMKISAEREDNPVADYLTDEYGKYLLSFNRGMDSDYVSRMSVLQKMVD